MHRFAARSAALPGRQTCTRATAQHGPKLKKGGHSLPPPYVCFESNPRHKTLGFFLYICTTMSDTHNIKPQDRVVYTPFEDDTVITSPTEGTVTEVNPDGTLNIAFEELQASRQSIPVSEDGGFNTAQPVAAPADNGEGAGSSPEQ